MKITKTKLRQIIKEELQSEIFGFGKKKSKPKSEPVSEPTPEPTRIKDEDRPVSIEVVPSAPQSSRKIELADERAFPLLNAAVLEWMEKNGLERSSYGRSVSPKGYTVENGMRKFYFRVPKGFLEITFKD
tara:strand:- start:4473 stop:4862 length:390 start_codon:yes stop_codon:yes gene_type:complete